MHHKNTSPFIVLTGLLVGLGGVMLLLRGVQAQARIVSTNPAGHDFLDPAFGSGGRVIIPISGTNQIAREVAIQPNGKVIVVGYDNWRSAERDNIVLARVNPNGVLDTGFGTNGVVTTSLSSEDDAGYAVAVQPDGKIVVAGASNDTAFVARYKTDGSLDTDFGNSGMVTTTLPSVHSWFLGVAVLGDGRIVAGGSIATTPAAFLLARYQSNGAPDTTLGGSGFVTTTIPGNNAYGWDIAIQPDGKVLLAGYSTSSGNQGEFALARYNLDGTLDGGFGTGGIVTQSLGATIDYAYSVNVQSDGKIVIGGQTEQKTGALARYNADGSYDNTFGAVAGRNYVTTTIPGYASVVFIETTLQANDSIVAATRMSGGPPAVGITVFDPDGLPKTAIGHNGVITTTNEGHGASTYALLTQPDGKIVLAGHVDFDDSGEFAYDMALWRYDLSARTRIYLPIVTR